MSVCCSQLLSVPLAHVTHLFYLKVNVGQSFLIAKEWISCERKKKKVLETFQWQLDTRPLKSLLYTFGVFCQPDSLPLRFEPGNYGAFGVRERTQMARLCHFSPFLLIRFCWFSAAFRSCLLCFFFNVLTDCAVCSRACCNDIPIARVICQVHFALGLTPRRSAYCVSQGEKHYTSPVFTEQFHPACMRGGLSSEPCLAFKCGKSAQSPPLTRNAARLSSWCSLNKLNNEGISEMPKRHYTPTIRASSE